MKKEILSQTFKAAGILGGLLSMSVVLETAMMMSMESVGIGTITLLYLVEWIAVAVLHFYLLFRFTKIHSANFSKDLGFSFGSAYGYTISISLFAGVITGVIRYVYLNLVVGHANYVDHIIKTMQTYVLENSALFQGSMRGMINDGMKQLEAAPEPTFYDYISGDAFTAVLFAIFFGLFIAGILSRPSQPFGEEITNE